MAASPSFKEPKPRVTSTSRRDKETQREFDRQQSLLAADFDKRTLKGNAVTEDWRHYKVCTELSQKERRENYQLRLEKHEMLKAIQKVQRGHTGHYDESKSPMENIQEALRVKSKTPVKDSKLTVPDNYPLRKVKSQDSLMLNQSRSLPRPVTAMAMGQSKAAAKLHENFDKPKTAQKSEKSQKTKK